MPRLRRKTPAKQAGPPRATADRRCQGRTRSGTQCRLWGVPSYGGFCKAHHSPAIDRRPELRGVGETSNRESRTALPPRGTVAAVARIRLDGQSWKDWSLTSRDWQKEAWRLYDITGPLRFVVNSIAKTASKARLFVGEIDDSGDIHTEAEDPEVAGLARGPLGSGEARAEAIRLMAVNLQVAGEAYVIAEGFDQAQQANADAEGARDSFDEDRWFVVSTEQISRQGDDIIIRRPALFGGGSFTPIEGKDILMRVWIPHPADIDEPDSSVRSAIPDLRELEALRKREFAELDSRLAGAGIFAVPDNMDFPRGDDGAEDGEGGLDGFLEDVGNAMSQSLQDRSSAAAMVPIGIQGPADAIEKIRHITFWSELSEHILPMKDSALRMLAQSLDAPVEMMQGMGQTNHWSAWLLDENTISTHIEPLLGQIANALTRGWLEPVLRRMGRDAGRYSYAFNTASLQVRGDKTNTALELHERRLISDAALREVTDFDDAMAPSAEERLRRMAEDAIKIAPSVMLVDPDVRRILGLNPHSVAEAEAIAEGRIPSPSRTGDEVEGELPPVPEEDRGMPDQPERGNDPVPPGLVAACNLAVLRALELAGGRLVPNRPRDAARHELHTRTDPAEVDRKRAEWALKGAWAHLAPQARLLGIADASGLEELLHQYCIELILRGVPHHSDLLEQVLSRALQGSRVQVRVRLGESSGELE